MDQCCRFGFTHSGDSKVDPFKISYKSDIYASSVNRHHWRFAFTYASTSSECILFAIRYLVQLNYFVGCPQDAGCIVSEMIDWLKVRDLTLIKDIFWRLEFGKNQTVDPQPQDKLIAWMEDANKKIEEAIAIETQWDIDADQQQSAEWADAIQSAQTAWFALS